MGLILDSSAVIAGERKGQSAADLLTGIRAIVAPEAIALSTVNVIELEHGIWRAKNAAGAGSFSMISLPPFQSIRSPSGSPAGRLGSTENRSRKALPFRSKIS